MSKKEKTKMEKANEAYENVLWLTFISILFCCVTVITIVGSYWIVISLPKIFGLL